MKKLGVILLLSAALPILCIVGVVLTGLALRPGFEPADPADPRSYLAVLGAWNGSDGTPRCRAFYWRDLRQHRDSIPQLRFQLSDSDFSVCAANVDAFKQDRTWPDTFSWERRARWADASRPDPEIPNLIEVVYPPGEEMLAVTRYELDATGEPTRFVYNAGGSSGWGVGVVVVGGVGGVVAWVMLLVGCAVAYRAAPHRTW